MTANKPLVLFFVPDCSSLGIDILLYDKDGTYAWNHEDRLNCDQQTSPYRRRGPTLTSTSKRLYQNTPKSLSKNVHRVTNWKQIIAQFPKPTSPLKYCCYYPNCEEEQESDYETEEEDEDEDMEEEEVAYNNHHYYDMDVVFNDNRVWV